MWIAGFSTAGRWKWQHDKTELNGESGPWSVDYAALGTTVHK